jgi:hypothetical protein
MLIIHSYLIREEEGKTFFCPAFARWTKGSAAGGTSLAQSQSEVLWQSRARVLRFHECFKAFGTTTSTFDL